MFWKLCTWISALTVASAAVAGQGTMEKRPDGIILPVGDGLLQVAVCADNAVRVAFAKDRAGLAHQSLIVLPAAGPAPAWNVSTDARQATLTTAALQVRIDLTTGAVAFADHAGKPIVAEKPGGRTLDPAEVQGAQTFHVRQQWLPNAGESLYGLGQHQLGLLDIKGYDLDLWQHNGTVAIPFLVSSRGYGILWDNPSYTRFGDLRDFAPIPAGNLVDATGKPGGLTVSYFEGTNFDHLIASRAEPKIDIPPPPGHIPTSHADTSTEHAAQSQPAFEAIPEGNVLPHGDASVRWEGQLAAPTTGDYQFQAFSNAGIKVWIDGKLVIDHWRQGWLPWIDLARVSLQGGKRYSIKVEWLKDQHPATVRLAWKPPADSVASGSPATSLWSEVGQSLDYYFIYGPDIDKVIAGYRQLTGQAEIAPYWAFGLWQSRQRYETAQQSLDVIAGYRSRGIPFDTIVQDWRYWPDDSWGSHQFDPVRFPHPDAWIAAIHDKFHARLMISVWGKFYTGTANFKAMHDAGYLYERNLKEGLRDWLSHPYTFYDAFNAGARALFWKQIDRDLFSKKIDAWWMDATEPDLTPRPTLEGQHTHMNPTALGPGSAVLNAYPLVNSQGIYEGQRQSAPNQRVFNLTRSAFAGQQRYAAATWSGDISSTWTALAKQIPAGLGFCISGIPYWTMDIGGFSVPPRFSSHEPKPQDVEEWRELNARWFEFGTFCPLLRVHGEFPHREMWEFGGDASPAYKAELKFDRLRYRLLPYVYSLAGDVTRNSGTMMRPLVMDFRDDAKAREIADQFMFGPAFLVSPVTAFKVRSRSVYLPSGTGWYDFWTGASLAGGASIDAAAAYDSIPLHVRAGSIIPFGPELQYTAEKPADPITLYVYTGADGSFSIYEDQGTTYDYEHGAFSLIPLHWDEAKQTLTIGARQGSFPGMLAKRTFNVVFVSSTKPVGFSFTPQPDQTVQYSGAAVQLPYARSGK